MNEPQVLVIDATPLEPDALPLPQLVAELSRILENAGYNPSVSTLNTSSLGVRNEP